MTPIRLAFLTTCALTVGLCRGVWAETPPTVPSEEEVASSPKPTEDHPDQANEAPSEEAPPEAPAPAPAPQAPEAASAAQSEPMAEPAPKKPKKDYSVPFYQQKRPRWALELSAAGRSALGSSSAVSTADPGGIRGFQFQAEYQPEWFQALGVLGVGVSGALYLTSPAKAVTDSLAGLLSYGYQFRYQARFIRNQWIVPFAGYRGQWVRYGLKNDVSGTLGANGAFFGGMILLSAFDEGSAAELYANMGISRVYLLAESRSFDASDASLTLSGSSYFFGLRFEF